MVPKLQALQRPISATNWQNVTSINHESEVWAALNLKWRNPKPFLGTPCSVGTNALSQRRVITTGAGFSKTGTPTVHFVLFAANKAARGQCGLNQVKYPCRFRGVLDILINPGVGTGYDGRAKGCVNGKREGSS